MRAIVQDTYGGPETFRLTDDAPVPAPGKGEVAVRVRAAAVDAATWLLATGSPRLVRLAFGLRRPRFTNSGQELAGTVAAVGPRVEGFAVGDEVFGQGTGTFAEVALADADALAHRPDGVTPEQAACLGVSGVTALRAHQIARVCSGQRVMVIGAGGGVGSFAVQLAVAAGASVTGVASGGKEDLVRRLGADRFVDYTAAPLTAAGEHDVVVETAGGHTLRELRAVLTRGGTAVHVGTGIADMTPSGGIGKNLRGALYGLVVPERFASFAGTTRTADLETLAAMVADGRLVPAVESVVPLEQTAEAVAHVGAGHAHGKTVVVP